MPFILNMSAAVIHRLGVGETKSCSSKRRRSRNRTTTSLSPRPFWKANQSSTRLSAVWPRNRTERS